MAVDANTGGLGGLGGWGAPNSGWQTQAYQDFLGRTPNADESGYWANKSANDFLASLPNSPEYRMNVVRNDYSGLTGRDADQAGLDYWSRPENFANAYSALQNSDEGRNYGVSQLFQNYLGRAPDSAGLSYWTDPNNFQNALSGGIANSDESRRYQVGQDYQRLLARAPDAEGLSYWSDPAHFDNALPSMAAMADPTTRLNLLSGFQGANNAVNQTFNPYANYGIENQLTYDNALNNPNNGRAFNRPEWNWTDPSTQGVIPLSQIPMPTMAEKLNIARTVAGEARGETDPNSWAAIVHNIRNRQSQGGWIGVNGGADNNHTLPFGTTLTTDPRTGILKQREYNGSLYGGFNPNSAQGRQIMDIIDQVYSGRLADPTHGSLSYLSQAQWKNNPPPWYGIMLPYSEPVDIQNHRFLGTISPEAFRNADGSYTYPDWYPASHRASNSGGATGPTDGSTIIRQNTLDTGTPTSGNQQIASIDPSTITTPDMGGAGTMTDWATQTGLVPTGVTSSGGVDPGYGNGSGNFGQGPDWVSNSGLMTTVNGGSANNGSSPLTSGTPYVNIYDYGANPYGFDFQMPW